MTDALNIEHFRKIAAERDWTLPTRMMLIKHLEKYSSIYESAVKGRSDFRQALKETREKLAQSESEVVRLREQFEWQTKNADNCRLDASRMGEKFQRSEAKRVKLRSVLQTIKEVLEDDAKCE